MHAHAHPIHSRNRLIAATQSAAYRTSSASNRENRRSGHCVAANTNSAMAGDSCRWKFCSTAPPHGQLVHTHTHTHTHTRNTRKCRKVLTPAGQLDKRRASDTYAFAAYENLKQASVNLEAAMADRCNAKAAGRLHCQGLRARECVHANIGVGGWWLPLLRSTHARLV